MSSEDRAVQRTPTAYSYPLLIKQLLHTPIRYAPETEIVYRDITRITYRDWYDRIHRLACALTRLGVGPADTVAVLDWDSHRYLECFFAVPMMGAVLHTVNIRLSAEQILYTMDHATDTIILVHEDFLPLLEDLQQRLPNVRHYILLKDGSGSPRTSLPLSGEYENLLEQAESWYDFPDFDENRHATLFYTTGTTGNPKGVCFSHRQLVLHTLGIGMGAAALTGPGRFQSGDVYMPITPMFHVHAWGFPYLATLLGSKQVYVGRYDPELILRLIEKEGVTFSHCVPTILHMLIHSPGVSKVNLRGWKVNTGGMALPRGLAAKLLDLGVDVFHGYGMSETCPVLTFANLKPHMMEWDTERQLDYRTKTGFPLPLVNLDVVDENGRSVPRDGHTPGEIVVRSPWTTLSYLKEPELSNELWLNGWLHTGDVATVDGEGYVQITDRLKDAIKTGGEWVSSLTLESLISLHEDVSEVAVVGAYDEKWGERPVALVVPLDGADTNNLDARLRDFLTTFVQRGVISKWAVPDTFLAVEEIPKTSVGKLDKKEIRRIYCPPGDPSS